MKKVLKAWPLALALVLAGGIAFATIPDSAGVIHACYKKSGGAVRIINSPTVKCQSTETAISWNQKGVPGPPGPSGSPAPTPPPPIHIGVAGGSFNVPFVNGCCGTSVTNAQLVPVPLTQASWIQKAGTFNVVYLRVAVSQATNSSDCQTPNMALNAFIDGTPVGPLVVLAMPLGSSQTRSFPTTQVYSLTPGVDGSHTIEVKAASDCIAGTVITDVSVDVTTIG